MATLLLMAVGISCEKPDDTLSLADYYDQVEALSQRAAGESDEHLTMLEQELDSNPTIEGSVLYLEAFLANGAETTDRFASDLRRLTAPDEVQDMHGDFIEATDSIASVLDRGARRLRDSPAGSSIEVVDAIRDELASAVEMADQACSRLEGYAQQASIVADLDCGLAPAI
jgi:hypothetical protein